MRVKMSNMCMIEKGNEVLVQLRTKKDWPGITFPGGKVEEQESIYKSCIREVKEETGLDVNHLELCGIVHYEVPQIEERWIIYLYKTNSFSGHLHSSNEGKVFWLKKEELYTKELSKDLDAYIELIENKDYHEYHAYWDEEKETIFEKY